MHNLNQTYWFCLNTVTNRKETEIYYQLYIMSLPNNKKDIYLFSIDRISNIRVNGEDSVFCLEKSEEKSDRWGDALSGYI